MPRLRSLDWFRRPERILADLITRHARGDDSGRRHFWRATVLAVDTEGGRLENPNGSGTFAVTLRDGSTRVLSARVGPENPRGSVKARLLTDGYDRLLDDDDVRTFWPMFPPDQLGIPIAPGEHVYVVFEDTGEDSMEHGMWVSRVPGQDSANAFLGKDSYTAPSSPASAVDAFTPTDRDYQADDDSASMAPNRSATKHFGG